MNAREKESAGEGVREGDQKRIARAREGVGVREHHARRATLDRTVGFEWADDEDEDARPASAGRDVAHASVRALISRVNTTYTRVRRCWIYFVL